MHLNIREKKMDKDIRQFQDDLIAFVNKTDLPWEVIRLVMSDVYELVAKKSNETIARQISMKEVKDEPESVHQD